MPYLDVVVFSRRLGYAGRSRKPSGLSCFYQIAGPIVKGAHTPLTVRTGCV